MAAMARMVISFFTHLRPVVCGLPSAALPSVPWDQPLKMSTLHSQQPAATPTPTAHYLLIAWL